PRGRYYFDLFMLKMPIIGVLLRKIAVARFTRTLGTLITSGVPILEGLSITAKTSGNAVLEEALMKVRKAIEEGRTIVDPLRESGVFPNMVVQMIGVCEATGCMHSMFDERLWLAWLVKARIIILTFLLGIELAIARLTLSPLPVRLFITSILLWYAFALFYLVLLSFWEEHRIQSLLQVLTDLALVTLVVYITGGVDSSLNFLYPLIIIVASILLPRSWAYLTAALAFILYGTVLELTYFGIVPSYSTTHPELGALQAIIFVNLFAYLAVAYLTGLLAAKLRQVDVK